MSYSVDFKDQTATITGLDHFDPCKVFDCGQCFNFDSWDGAEFSGVVNNRIISVSRQSDGSLIIKGVDKEHFPLIASYLCLDDDYSLICGDILSSMEQNGVDTEIMKKAMELGLGIRLMKQDHWQTLCSFIISQNNNIPRIKKIIATLCQRYGEVFYHEGKEYHTFPTPQALYQAGEGELFDCKTGFRAKYIFDAAKRVVTNETDLDLIDTMSTEEAAKELMKIKGVGPKVASCVLLFGYGKKDAFPIDVWVKKVLSKYYPPDFSPAMMGKYSGIAQQYLFYYERYLVSKEERAT